MKCHFITCLALSLLLAAPATQAVVFEAASIQAAGQVTDLHVRLLELQRPSDAAPWTGQQLQLEAGKATLEEWYEDSGGTPIGIEPQPSRSTVYEGSIHQLAAIGRPSHFQFLYAANASLASAPYVELAVHDRVARSFPDFMAPTGGEEDVALRDTLAATVPDGHIVRVSGSFTLVLWNWNITIEGSEGPYDAWSGTRPHGMGNGVIAPFGYDAQLLVLRVQEGEVIMPVPSEDLQAFHLTADTATVTGTIRAKDAWQPGAAQQNDVQFQGNHTLNVQILNASALRANVAAIPEPAESDEVAAPAPQTVTPAPPAGSGPQWSVPAYVALAVAMCILTTTWQWRHLKAAYRRGDYTHVAAKAARFHYAPCLRAQAQVMTMVAALKMGHPAFVLEHLPRLKAIAPTVAGDLRRHASQALDLLGDGRPAQGSRDPQQSVAGWIRDEDASAAYS